MPAPRETTYDIGGEKLILKATEVKTLGKVIEVLKKENTFLKAAVELEKKKADIQMRALKAGRLETEETKKRMVIVENIQKRVIAFYEKQQTAAKKANTETAKAIKPRAPRGPKQPYYEIGDMMRPALIDWIDTGGKPSKKKDEAPTGVGEKGAFGEVVRGMLIGIGFKLIGVIEKGISESQHLRTVEDILTKTIGLLVDLVLFPFLPLIVYFLMKFVTFTVTLGMMWKDLTKQLGMPLGLSITAGGAILGMLLAGAAVSAIVNLIAAGEAWLLLLLTGAGKYVVSAIADIVARGAAWLLKLLAGAPLSVQIVAAVALGLVIGAAVVKLLEVSGALDAIYRAGENIRKNNAEWFQSLYNNIGPVQNALNTLADMMNSVLGTSFLTNKKMSELISTGTYNAETIKRLREKYGMGVSYSAMGGYTLAGRRLESFQSGGVIPGPIGAPRVVTVHGGERVVPAGKSVGDTTVNFYGYQDDKFVAKVKEIMRREGARYQV